MRDDAARANAARTAAGYATDAAELRMFLSMLGLPGSPGSPPCRACGEPTSRLSSSGYNQAAGDGLCARHHQAAKPTPPTHVTGRCTDCHRPTARRRDATHARYGGRGMCEACYTRWRRSRESPPHAAAGVCHTCGGPTPDRRHTCTGCRVLIPAWPIQDHVQALRDSGKAVHRIAVEADLPTSTVRGVVGGWARVTTHIADQLLSVTS